MKHPRPGLSYVPVKELDRSKMSFEDYTVEDPADEKVGKLEGFILDVDRAIPYYVVVDAGGWFRSKHVLVPIGHVALDSESKKLVADVPKERMKRFPGFDLSLFPKLTQEDLTEWRTRSRSCAVRIPRWSRVSSSRVSSCGRTTAPRRGGTPASIRSGRAPAKPRRRKLNRGDDDGSVLNQTARSVGCGRRFVSEM